MNDPYVSIFTGNCMDILPQLEANSVQCVVTSPPYWGLRKYDGDQDYIWNNHNGCEHEWTEETLLRRSNDNGAGDKQCTNAGSVGRDEPVAYGQCLKCGAWKGGFGMETTVDLYIEHTIEILRAVSRVLKEDGIVWWNVGDSYASGKGTCFNPGGGGGSFSGHGVRKDAGAYPLDRGNVSVLKAQGLKPKDLCLIPFRVALAAQADGWYVRSVVIWSKPNPMPESVKDRPTGSYEYILMLTKSSTYYFDQEAVKETQKECTTERYKYGWNGVDDDGSNGARTGSAFKKMKQGLSMGEAMGGNGKRNICSVWEIATQPFKGAHFATFPEEIPRRCILASTSEKGNCAKCGRPWVRIVEPVTVQPESWKGSRFDDGKNLEVHPNVGRRENARTECKNQDKQGNTLRLALLRQQARQNGGEYSNENITMGWKASCKCCADVVKPIVLDLFGGSGTTSKVAKELGRKSIYIDTSEKYCSMARQRIQLVTLPMELSL
jgi:DNA modification methylase